MGRVGSGEEAGTVPYTYKCICTLHTVYLSTMLDQSYKELTLTSQLTVLEQQYRAWV